jgi:hypothetical protein
MAVLVPNGTVYNPGGLSGAASAHAALSDSSNTSYVEHAPEWSPGVYEVGTFTKTAGSVVKHMRAIVKASSISVNPVKIRWGFQIGGVNYGETSNLQISGTTPTVYNGPWWDVGDATQATIDALRVYVDAQPLWTSARFYEASIEVVEAAAPTTTITEPAGNPTTSTFDIAWTHTAGSEGGVQSAWHIKIFPLGQVTQSGFDVDTAPALYDSGLYPDGRDRFAATLATGSYRIYVRTAQSIYGRQQTAAWAYVDRTVGAAWTGADYATVAAVTAAGDATEGAVEVIVDIDPATATADHVELERSVDVDEWVAVGLDGTFESGGGGTSTIGAVSSANVPDGFLLSTGGGGEPASPTSAIQNTPSPWNNNYWIIGGTFDQDDRLTAAPFDYIDVNPGDTVTVEADIHSGLGTNCVMRMGIAFLDESLNLVAGNTETEFGSWSAWRHYSHSLVAPVNSRKAVCQVSIFGNTGASAAACLLSLDNFRLSKTVAWTAVRDADTVTPVGDQVTILDYEAPPHATIRYRARATTAAGVVGEWVYTNDYAELAIERGVWIKDPLNPGLNTLVGLVKAPREWPIRQGVFEPAGAAEAVVISDVRSSRRVPFVFQTPTAEVEARLRAVITNRTVLIQPATTRFASGYFALGDLEEDPMTRWGDFPFRRWEVPGIEVAAP